jgi:ribulose-bisphosphate carboxylase large chain
MLDHEMTSEEIPERFRAGVLQQKWYGMKTVIPVSSGGLHPGIVPDVLKLLGNDCVLQLGGGMHGHPKGTKEGAKAFRQAIDAFFAKKTLEEYAKKPANKALKIALEHFGYKHPI